MRKFIAGLLLAALVTAASFARAAEAPLVLGVFPYISRVQLMAQHAPLRTLIEKTLHHPVDFVTAPDFDQFAQRTKEGDYDVVLTAPHLGRLAQVRDGYIPLVRTGHEVQAVFLARGDSSIRSVSDLKGKTIMIAQPVSIVYQLAAQYLRDHHLVPGKDVTIIPTRTHNNALYAPARGEADASATGVVLWQTAEPAIKAQLVEIGATRTVPGFIVLANHRMPPGDVKKLKTALLHYPQTPEGKAYFDNNHFKGFTTIDPKDMKSMDPYIDVFLDRKK
jgi:phosphonate transport system substrate-binding protein